MGNEEVWYHNHKIKSNDKEAFKSLHDLLAKLATSLSLSLSLSTLSFLM